MKTDGNDLINPIKESKFDSYAFETVGGLTKREHFAAMALQGILSTVPTKDLMQTMAYVYVKIVI